MCDEFFVIIIKGESGVDDDLLAINLKQLRGKHKLTQEEFAVKLGIARSTYSGYETGKTEPDNETLQKIADYFEVSTDYLLGRTDSKFPHGLQLHNPVNMVRLPILGAVRAGEPILMNDNIESYIEIESDVLRGKQGFVLRVKGDSMTGDGIFDGDLAIIELKEEVETNEIAVVAINNEEACLKRVECLDGICTLSSSNSAYKPMMYKADVIHIIGVVVETRRRHK